ncbi:hypothetical protein B0H34DRAFT_679769 [Crassisporium funariophilum]|nr:hypothetical protein B0H34DRAFT_679769 [Crassisporium funariophilum]
MSSCALLPCIPGGALQVHILLPIPYEGDTSPFGAHRSGTGQVRKVARSRVVESLIYRLRLLVLVRFRKMARCEVGRTGDPHHTRRGQGNRSAVVFEHTVVWDHWRRQDGLWFIPRDTDAVHRLLSQTAWGEVVHSDALSKRLESSAGLDIQPNDEDECYGI